MSKICKSLDLNKLYEQQAKGKLLKKVLKFPLIAQIKYDGNYVVVRIENGRKVFSTSGSHNYVHTDDGASCFDDAIDGVYLAERIAGEGKLGDRVRCNLRGPKSAQTSTGHGYRVFDMVDLEDYDKGSTTITFLSRYTGLRQSSVAESSIVECKQISNKEELDDYLREVVNNGYEGLMLYQPDFKWRDTKSRTIDLAKYKKRRTADLLCISTTEGEGKYEGLLGSLVLRDSAGIVCSVGSGLSDYDRNCPGCHFVGKIIEIEYEQIIDSYIQPTFIRIREDKEEED